MSAELYPCRRCKTNSEYADFCSQKCASEWKGFHEQEIEDLKSKLTAAESEIKKLKREIEVLRQYGNKDCTGQADEVLESEGVK